MLLRLGTLFLLFIFTPLQAQQTAPNTIVISDTSKKSGGVSNGLTDRVTLLDGSVLVGKITEISGTKIVIKVSGLDYVVEPGRVARIERNINQDSLGTQHRNVVVKTKDGSQFRGILNHSPYSVPFSRQFKV